MPLTIMQPWWALLLFVPIVLFGVRHWRIHQCAQHYCSPRLMPWMRFTQNPWRDLPWRWLLVWFFLVLALCQPNWVTQQQSVQHPIEWVAVVDMSDSMQAQDVLPSRLQQARWLLESSTRYWQQGDRVGLIAFSASHHWLMPLTTDQALWQSQLALLEPNLLPLRGSSLQKTIADLDAHLPKNVALLILSDGGGLDLTSAVHPLSHSALMVVFGKGVAVLPTSVSDGEGVNIGVPFSQVKRLAYDWRAEWVSGEQASLELDRWLTEQRHHVEYVASGLQQGIALSSLCLSIALLLWFSFWQIQRCSRSCYLLIVISVMIVFYQAHAVEDKTDAAQSSQQFQKAFREALTEAAQVRALQGLAMRLQEQHDWFSAAQAWRGVLAYQPEDDDAKRQLHTALSHLPKSVEWSGEGGRRPKGSREGVIDDWPDMPEQEETQDVLRESTGKHHIELDSPSTVPIPPPQLSQLAQQQKQRRTDTLFLGEARTLGAQQRLFYQRLFEQEAGFAAAQSEPQRVDGVVPW